MTDHENTWDKLLKIKTSGRDDTNADGYRYPYEPTPYCILERLAASTFSVKRMLFWIMDAEKGVLISFCLIRPKRKQLALNMMNEFIIGRWKIRRPPFQGQGLILN